MGVRPVDHAVVIRLCFDIPVVAGFLRQGRVADERKTVPVGPGSAAELDKVLQADNVVVGVPAVGPVGRRNEDLDFRPLDGFARTQARHHDGSLVVAVAGRHAQIGHLDNLPVVRRLGFLDFRVGGPVRILVLIGHRCVKADGAVVLVAGLGQVGLQVHPFDDRNVLGNGVYVQSGCVAGRGEHFALIVGKGPQAVERRGLDVLVFKGELGIKLRLEYLESAVLEVGKAPCIGNFDGKSSVVARLAAVYVKEACLYRNRILGTEGNGQGMDDQLLAGNLEVFRRNGLAQTGRNVLGKLRFAVLLEERGKAEGNRVHVLAGHVGFRVKVVQCKGNERVEAPLLLFRGLVAVLVGHGAFLERHVDVRIFCGSGSKLNAEAVLLVVLAA